MEDAIPIHLAVEDPLSEAVLRVLLRQSQQRYAIGPCYGKRGFGYLKENILGFNNASKGTPFLVLTDLDRWPCPPALIQAWLPQPKHANLLLWVAVRAVESWILAHHDAFAKFLGIRQDGIPLDVDGIPDPKQFLIRLARSSRRRDLREDIVPPDKSMRKQGPNYNGRLAQFVGEDWKASSGASRSLSLKRTIAALNRFQPVVAK